jgi:tripeptide aminopeptidase
MLNPALPGLALLLMASSAAALAQVAEEDASAEKVEWVYDPGYLDELEQLRQAPPVQAALDHIIGLEASSMKDLVELTEIPAPPFAEEPRGLRFAEMLREAGLGDVRIDEVGNVIGRRPGSNGQRVVAYAAHLDTVFPAETDVTVKFRDGRYFAPGIGDNTRGLVVVLNVLRALQFAGIETKADVLFIGNVGEEGLGDLRGVKHLFRPGAPTIDAFIAVDGGEMQRLVYGGVGSHRYRVEFRGPGGHAWGAFGSANPHHALASAIARFVEAADPITREGPKSSYNIGRMGGGTSINSIPFESWAEVDIRSGDPAKIKALDAVLQQEVQTALASENAQRRKGPELTVVVQQVGDRPAARGDLSAALPQRALATLRSLGLEPQPALSSTDANLPISLGIPAISMSRGGISGDAHAPGEWWQAEAAHIGVQAGFLTLLAEAGWAGQ